MAEAFPTIRAFVWSLSRVGDPMSDEVGPEAEALSAVKTIVGLLSRVGPLMPVAIRPFGEAFPAVDALIGLLARVDPFMGQEVGRLSERLPTFITGSWDLGSAPGLSRCTLARRLGDLGVSRRAISSLC